MISSDHDTLLAWWLCGVQAYSNTWHGTPWTEGFRRQEEGSKHRVYSRPEKKPVTKYECDPVKLQSSWQLRGGDDFACQWILAAFKHGVTLGTLVRRLELTGIME